MNTISNKIITSALIASMLLPNAAVASMHEPTTPDNLEQVVAISQTLEEGIPTPYADISNPSVLLTTTDIQENNGGVLVDTRIPKEEWLESVIVVHQDGYVGNIKTDDYKDDTPSLFSNYPGWNDIHHDKATLDRATLELGGMTDHSVHEGKDMTNLSLKHTKERISRSLMSTSPLFAHQMTMEIGLMATKNANIVNLNEASNIMEKEILSFVSPQHYESVSRYWRSGWIVHEIGHSHHHQDISQDNLVYAGSTSNNPLQTLSSTKIKMETHSDAQMILAVQSTMLANGEPQETIDAYTDGIIRMREEIAASLNKKIIQSVASELPLKVDTETHKITLSDPNAPGTDGALLSRVKHDTTLGIYAMDALISANAEQAKTWDFAQKGKVMDAFYHALEHSPYIQKELSQRDDLMTFSNMSDTEFANAALDLAKDMASELNINAPSALRSVMPLAVDGVEYLQNGFIEVERQSLYNPRMPVKASLVLNGGDGPIKTAIVTPKSATREHDRLLIPLTNNSENGISSTNEQNQLLSDKLSEHGIAMMHISTHMEGQRRSEASSSVLSITLTKPGQLSVAMDTVGDWLNEIKLSPQPSYEGGFFSLNKSTARLFDHTYLATRKYDGIDADSYAKDVLLQSFGDTMRLFDVPSPHAVSQNTPDLDASLQHKLSR